MGDISPFPIDTRTWKQRTHEAKETLPPGIFHVTFNNRRKQGRGLQTHTCEAVLFTSGHVSLDTMFTPTRDFVSLGDMIEHFEQYGDCIIQGEA